MVGGSSFPVEVAAGRVGEFVAGSGTAVLVLPRTGWSGKVGAAAGMAGTTLCTLVHEATAARSSRAITTKNLKADLLPRPDNHSGISPGNQAIVRRSVAKDRARVNGVSGLSDLNRKPATIGS